MVEWVGPERRRVSKEERRRYAEENGVPEPDTLKITLSVKNFVLIVCSILGLSGGGSIAYQKAVAPKEAPMELEAIRVRLSVLESRFSGVERAVEKQDARSEDTNRVVRLLASARGINPDKGLATP